MYHLSDIVQMKKPHACGENKWEIMRMGADIRIKCMGCGHDVMMPRTEFNKKLKTVLNIGDNFKSEYYVQKAKIIVPKF